MVTRVIPLQCGFQQVWTSSARWIQNLNFESDNCSGKEKASNCHLAFSHAGLKWFKSYLLKVPSDKAQWNALGLACGCLSSSVAMALRDRGKARQGNFVFFVRHFIHKVTHSMCFTHPKEQHWPTEQLETFAKQRQQRYLIPIIKWMHTDNIDFNSFNTKDIPSCFFSPRMQSLNSSYIFLGFFFSARGRLKGGPENSCHGMSFSTKRFKDIKREGKK